MMALADLLVRLRAWREHEYHSDRQLADEVLIATGWSCEPDVGFQGGVRWFFGSSPQYSSTEAQRPHPINVLDHALGQIPMGWALDHLCDHWHLTDRLRTDGATCKLTNGKVKVQAEAPERAVAVCIAIVMALATEGKP